MTNTLQTMRDRLMADRPRTRLTAGAQGRARRRVRPTVPSTYRTGVAGLAPLPQNLPSRTR